MKAKLFMTEYDALNDRRIDLICKKLEHGLTLAECQELDHLQAWTAEILQERAMLNAYY